jgi:hypothetical protein
MANLEKYRQIVKELLTSVPADRYTNSFSYFI